MIKILQKNSPNHYNGRGGYKPDIIVDHITGGSFSSAINTFLNPACEVSAHFVVSKSGEIVQMVDLKNGAWCNGTTTDNSNRSYKKATSRLVKSRKTNANYYTISIEHENAGGGALTAAQLAATIELHRYITQQVKALFGVTIPADREHIIGHCEISPIKKPCCPGANFPFAKIIAGLGGAGVPENPPVPVLPNGGKTYTVKPGDSWWKIAAEQLGSGSKMETLVSFNGKKISDMLYPGQTLKLPQ